ncbi:MAG: hypothetical protein QGH70_11465, partial [Nitrospinota bacterium]|nr:hypothetical protein [Nitrospinota bacterium]
MHHKLEIEIGGRTLIVETGEMAKQADGAVVVTYGESMILAAVVAEQAEKQRVVQHQHVSGKNPAAGALVKTGLAQFGDVGAVAA